MYYINREQLNSRFQFMAVLVEASGKLSAEWEQTPLAGFAQERILHLAIENVTDIGSLLIDGFLMRDASSYEDIIEILLGEQVFSQEIGEPLIELVKLRKPLVQNYFDLDRSEVHPLLSSLPALLEQFMHSTRVFMDKELGAAGQQP